MTCTNMAQVRQANRDAGQFWFSPSTLRFFNSRPGRRLYGFRYFISSERYDWNTPRRYTVREVTPKAHIETVGEFQQYATRAQALAAIRELQKG